MYVTIVKLSSAGYATDFAVFKCSRCFTASSLATKEVTYAISLFILHTFLMIIVFVLFVFLSNISTQSMCSLFSVTFLTHPFVPSCEVPFLEHNKTPETAQLTVTYYNNVQHARLFLFYVVVAALLSCTAFT
jgi:hypothetical protein